MSDTYILAKFIDTEILVNTLEREHEYDIAKKYSTDIISEVLKEIYENGEVCREPKLFEYECTMCGDTKSNVTIRTRNTMYAVNIHNYHLVCSECNEIDREQMQGLWDEVNADIYAGLNLR